MKFVLQKCLVKSFLVILCIAILSANTIQAQTCPQPGTTIITSYSNTYYPGQQAMVNAGSTSVAIAAASYGTTPISAGDVVTGAGFRGGDGVQLVIDGPGAGNRDLVYVSPPDDNIYARVGNDASKGEGIAGTPRLVNSNHYGVRTWKPCRPAYIL